MATENYMVGRKKYQRPQAMLWADNPGSEVNGIWVPDGQEIGADAIGSNFIILTDDNRSQIDFSSERIEQRQRMVNGRMRSYHISDKKKISVSWNMIPSRSFAVDPNFDSSGTSISANNLLQYTTDGGAGGVEMLDWYENHTGSFWVYLAYDKYNNFDTEKYSRLGQYNEVVEMFFADFSYNVEKRGGTNYDFWTISVTLEEV